MIDTQQQTNAVAAALAQNWKDAIAINCEILKSDTQNFEALSRLAYAYMRSGELPLAKKTYEKVLQIDQYNHIALKNIKKLSSLKKDDITLSGIHNVSPLMFLEEPGKTKVVDCINLAPNHSIAGLSSGEEVFMKSKNHCIEIRTRTNNYLGALPDDVSFKLAKLLDAGNTYQVIIKSTEKNTLKILIRELSRGKEFANQPSFTSTTSYIPFSKGGTTGPMGDSPDMTPTGEDTESSEPLQEAEDEHI